MTRLRIDNLNNQRIKPQFFEQQNTFFKVLLILSGLYAGLFLRWQYLFAIYIITLLWLTVSYRLLSHYLKLLLRITPFITSYLFLGLIFKLSFQEQLIFIGRINLLLLYSVFLFKTVLTERLIVETKTIRRWSFVNRLFIFGLATGCFISLFFEQVWKAKGKIKKIDDIINIIVDSFENVYLQIDDIEQRVKQLLVNEDREGYEFFNAANVYLTFLFTLYILILAL